jgi:flagellar hook-basal body complex protein FliE
MGNLGGGVGGVGGGDGGAGASPLPKPTGGDDADGQSFGSMLKDMVITKPGQTQAYADKIAAQFAAGDTSIDPGQLAIASAKAGVEVQMATRTITQAVSAVRTLFQMQI